MSQDFDAMATELLRFIESPLEQFEDKEHRDAYQLQRTSTFLEMRFGRVAHLERQIEVLRDDNRRMQPIVSKELERQEAVRRNHPFKHLFEEG